MELIEKHSIELRLTGEEREILSKAYNIMIKMADFLEEKDTLLNDNDDLLFCRIYDAVHEINNKI